MKTGLAAALVILGTFAGLTATGVGPASAMVLDSTATIANPGGLTALTSGGSETQFTLNLPAQASCYADSAKGGFLVYSYMVKPNTNLSTLSYVNGPPSGTYGLVTSPHTYFGSVNTAATTGQVIGVPNDFEWAPLTNTSSGFKVPLSSILYTGGTSGIWDVGLLCAKAGKPIQYWNTKVTFTASGSDPNGFVWSDTPGTCVSNTAPAFYSPGISTFAHGSNHKLIVAASGCPAPTITETGALPAGVTFNKTTGVLSGNPTTGGVFKLTFSAKAGTAKAVTQAFTLTVPLFISTASLASVKPGAKYSATLKASGGKSPYTWAVTKALPSGLKLSTAGVISGTLAKTVKAGKYPVDLKVTDSTKKATATAALSLTVT
jgi:hypothetical protein